MRRPVEADRVRGVVEFAGEVHAAVRYSLGKPWERATSRDILTACALATRKLLIDRMLETEARYRAARAKRVYYLSLEFLIGRSLGNNLLNLGLAESADQALEQLGVDLDEVAQSEPDAALGNGGLGRLAACYLDSMATLDLPGIGYGINYEHGLFQQRIESGRQREYPDSWRALGTPWLIERRDEAVFIPVFGRLERRGTNGGAPTTRWTDWRVLVGVPHDMPIAGYGGHTVNPLRLYSAHALEEFDIGTFQAGHHVEAFRGKLDHERISKLLYPADESDAGKELRLLQEYFFVACALRDVLHRHLEAEERLEDLPERAAIQLNDTHPALAIVELLRLFVDEHGLPLERAWELVQRTFAYTNHTLLPEALERWSQPLLERVLPRHMDLIEQINGRFLEGVVERWPGDLDRMRRMSIIEEGHPKHVRMANLAIVGSHAVNGVSELHTELIRTRLVPDFHALWPERFQNKTNGISPRRWLCKANPGLAALVTEHIGKGWECDLERLRGLEEWADDPAFQEAFRGVKRENKQRLAALVKATTGVRVDPSSLFDVHVKRLHEYKRQLLAAMHVIHLYLSIVEDGNTGRAPRTCIFAGKAAPGYFIAKLVLKLISEVARTVNADPRTEGRLRVVFVPDYRVTLAERIIPAADLSEQISTAGHEASGTGNMKLALNGALTIGTLDGANIEIRDAVGPENIYIFGLRAHEVEELRASGAHDPRRHYESNANLRRILDAIGGDRFCPGEPAVFRPIWNNLLEHGDPYLHLADFGDYALTQQRVERDFQDESSWTRRAIYNVARVGHFSSDRAIREYAAEIWGIEPVS